MKHHKMKFNSTNIQGRTNGVKVGDAAFASCPDSNLMLYCKKCKKYRGHYNYEESYECYGCGLKVLKPVVPHPIKLEKRAQNVLYVKFGGIQR